MSTRREFIQNSVLTAAGVALGSSVQGAGSTGGATVTKPLVISTWNFGLEANEAAMKVLLSGGGSLDAVEAGVRIPEDDPIITSVGRGSFPDADGDITLDACIMDGNGRCGAVACLENTLHPISVARDVMEKTPHVFLVGQKAREFAKRMGHPKVDLHSPASRKAYKEWKAQNPKWKDISTDISNHDTIGMLAIDESGKLAGACTTSGWAFKIPGRVGDSPIIGAGLYVDNEVGAATSTGTGEEAIRICASFLIVELMRNGMSPRKACEEAIQRVKKYNSGRDDLFIAFLAINKNGEYGSFATKPGFEFALYANGENQLIKGEY